MTTPADYEVPPPVGIGAALAVAAVLAAVIAVGADTWTIGYKAQAARVEKASDDARRWVRGKLGMPTAPAPRAVAPGLVEQNGVIQGTPTTAGTFTITTDDAPAPFTATCCGGPIARVEWSNLVESVRAEIGGALYDHSIRRAVESSPGRFCRVDMVLVTLPHYRPGEVGVDMIKVTCPARGY